MSKNEKVARFRKSFVQDWVDAILWAFVVAMIIRNYTFQNFKIPSSSMEQTLLVGDYLVANKMKYHFTEPKRGDIVTFRNPDDPPNPNDRDPIKDPDRHGYHQNRYVRIVAPVYWDKAKGFFTWYEKKNIVKRVVGLPGETIELRDKQVYINGEFYLKGEEIFRDPRIIPKEVVQCIWDDEVLGSRDNFGPVTVPEGHYFVMGDNRDHSHDSRFFGFLSKEDITGTPAMIFFSKDAGTPVRWGRSFKLIK